ncbi:MAG: iron-containing alcohol dehydrogenase [Desulfobacter sp.]|nr:iron-containing alcohol dehydrogenase [Desulfobacter sp.]WDP84341.1 MAG: iron-containing alcohol dehydrogenase [Desulfobacter sp.]
MNDLNPEFNPFFMWSNRPKILYAPGVREELGFELQTLGAQRPLFITDRGVREAGVTQMVIDAARADGFEPAGIFDEILQDARIDIINKGAPFYKTCRADAMVVVGGGSVMDTAQAINIMIGEGIKDFRPLAEQAALYENPASLPPQVVFPTTAGTGSEVTNGLVVLDSDAGKKIGVAHPFNADIAMLDPELILGLPQEMTAATGMDALTHALGGEYKIPHGIANAILLPWVMAFNLEAAPERYAIIAKALGVNTQNLTLQEAGQASVEAVIQLKKKFISPPHLRPIMSRTKKSFWNLWLKKPPVIPSCPTTPGKWMKRISSKFS